MEHTPQIAADTTPAPRLSRDEARELTDEVRSDAEALWLKLLRLYNGAAHLALGYRSWGDYFEAEFGQSPSRGKQLLRAARVVDALQGTMVPSQMPSSERQARELVPLLKDEAQLVEAWREVKEKHGDTATAVDVKRVVENRIERIKREQDAANRRLDLASRSVVPIRTNELLVEHADLATWMANRNLAGATVISDPPYPREFLPAWQDLATHGIRAGINRMVLMCGQTIMADAINIFTTAGWPLRWCCAYLTSGPATRVWSASFGSNWKPLLVFDRSDKLPFVTRDVFASNGDDKRFHYWGQNETAFAAIVEAFTKPGDLVVDPFLGGGTTAVVCRDLGRRFAGCDIDAAAVNATLDRLAA